MKKILIIPFILFALATLSSWSTANDAKIAQSHELSKHRHADQNNTRKHAHKYDLKQKSRYDLRDLAGKQKGDSHGHGHKHGDKDGHNHDHEAVSKHNLRDKGGGHAHEDAHQSHEDGHGSHDDHGHEGHEHGYDRLWGIGVSG